MSQKIITLHLPDELYERVQQAADASARPLETVLLESLDALFSPPAASVSPEALLAALPGYSDAQLWAVVYRQLPWTHSLRLRELIAKGKQGTLTEAEDAELNRLTDLVDRSMVLRSEALLLLQQRGQDISGYLNLGGE